MRRTPSRPTPLSPAPWREPAEPGSRERALGLAIDEGAEPQLEAYPGEERAVEFSAVRRGRDLDPASGQRARELVCPRLQLIAEPPTHGHAQPHLVGAIADFVGDEPSRHPPKQCLGGESAH